MVIVTILAIIGAITLLILFCVVALLVATHVMYAWQNKSYQERRSSTKAKQQSKRKKRK